MYYNRFNVMKLLKTLYKAPERYPSQKLVELNNSSLKEGIYIYSMLDI